MGYECLISGFNIKQFKDLTEKEKDIFKKNINRKSFIFKDNIFKDYTLEEKNTLFSSSVSTSSWELETLFHNKIVDEILGYKLSIVDYNLNTISSDLGYPSTSSNYLLTVSSSDLGEQQYSTISIIESGYRTAYVSSSDLGEQYLGEQ